MKKFISMVILSFLISSVFAQRGRGNGEIKWLSLAIKGGYGGTILLNKDVLSDKNVSLNYLSPSFFYGGRFGITYGDHIGINIEPLFSNFSEEYSIKANTQPYKKKQKFTSFDILISLRFITSYGFYLETGPQFSTLKTAKVENSISGAFNENQLNNYMDNFSAKNTSLAFGMGFAAINQERLQLFVGLRTNYGFSNFVNNPAYYVLNDGVYAPTYAHNAKTSPISFKLLMELNYFFGFWGNATCGRGRLMFFQ